MSRIITVFGATGAQGSGVINTVLSTPTLKEKYSLRAVTRDPSSEKAQALQKKGVALVQGDLNNQDSLRETVKGSYGVFGMTDFWSIHSKEVEIQQGLNLFEAVKAEKITHYVWSSLPHALKLTGGTLTQLPYFDGKADVEEHIEKNKGEMIASYFWPAMFYSFIENLIRGGQDGSPHLTLPVSTPDSRWPFIDPPRDAGKFIMGLFEAGRRADSARVHAVSSWTTPRELVATLSKESGKNVDLRLISYDEFVKDFPDNIAGQLTETLLMAIEHGVYGTGEAEKQAAHDQWLVEGAEAKINLEDWVRRNGPWSFETKSFFDILADQKTNLLNGHAEQNGH